MALYHFLDVITADAEIARNHHGLPGQRIGKLGKAVLDRKPDTVSAQPLDFDAVMGIRHVIEYA